MDQDCEKSDFYKEMQNLVANYHKPWNIEKVKDEIKRAAERGQRRTKYAIRMTLNCAAQLKREGFQIGEEEYYSTHGGDVYEVIYW